MTVPRDPLWAAVVGLGDLQSCRVSVHVSSSGNSTLLHREVNTRCSCKHGALFLSPTQVDSPTTCVSRSATCVRTILVNAF